MWKDLRRFVLIVSVLWGAGAGDDMAVNTIDGGGLEDVHLGDL